MNTLDIAYLHECFIYEYGTGIVSWRCRPMTHFSNPKTHAQWNSRCAGKEAGTLNSYGYKVVKVGGTPIMVHRVAYALFYGKWPKDKLDHRNRMREDNRIENLREATEHQNQGNKKLQKNNTTGFKGVSYVKRKNRYRAQIKIEGRILTLGTRKTAEEASGMYLEAATKHFGEFATLG